MKIGVISDSHGNEENIRKSILKLKEVDIILHLGDLNKDCKVIEKYTNKKVYSVLGNCDLDRDGATELLLEFEGVRFFLTHGHIYGVKYNLNNIYYKALELEANAVLFGHTHIPINMKENDIYLLNPGSITYPKGKIGKSYAIINVSNGEFNSDIFEL